MDSKQEQELVRMVQQIAKSEAMQHAGKLYEFGLQNAKAGLLSIAIPQLQATLEVGDPFYSGYALLILANVYKQIKDQPKEFETLKKLISLPVESRRFVDPEGLGIAYLRLGDADSAVTQYSLAIRLNGENVSRMANLAEALLVQGNFEAALAVTNKLVAQASVDHMIVGRILKGACLWFIGQKAEAASEFQFVGDFLVSAGSVPPSLNWDFRDSEHVISRVELPVARSVIEVLRGKTDFATFREKWLQTSGQTQLSHS